MAVMKTIIGATTALVVGTLSAQAGGFDRSGLPIGWIFEKGNYAELSFGSVAPDITASGNPYGDVGGDYIQLGMAVKVDLNEQLSLGLSVDQPYGASINYNVFGLNANLTSSSINAVARYKFSERFAVHAGLRYVTVEGTLQLPPPFPVNVQQTFSADSDIGYLIGASYEIPDIALRVALTYYSETEHTHTSSAGPAVTPNTINPPQSVNLDFQTGIAKDTLLFGQIRWADWTNTQIVNAGFPIVTYSEDVYTYSLGVGRRFSETFSAAVSLGYEKAQGGTASRLAPTDGYWSIGVGGTYTIDNMKITAGVRYVDIGDATTAGLPVNTFVDNSAIGVGLKVGWNF
jgi:long-chain fatty acid transport protein